MTHFDLVVCSATLEHDKHFWLSVREMQRVLKPGGLLIISVPGYVQNPERDQGRATHTYRVHYKFDYYRFSEQAVREVFFDGMSRVRVKPVMFPPRIFGHGYKPRPEPPAPSRAGGSKGTASAKRSRDRARRTARRIRARF